MAARCERRPCLGARHRRCGRCSKGPEEERQRWEEKRRQQGSAARRKRRVQEIRAIASTLEVNQILGLCLATNLVLAQAAVVRDSWFGIDKIKHFFISAFVESISYSALQAAHVKRRPALVAAIGLTAGIGVARELHDRKKPGNRFSYKDLTWDALGITAGAVMLNHTNK